MRQLSVGAAFSLVLCLGQVSAHGLAQPVVGPLPAALSSEEGEVTRRGLDRQREAIKATLLQEQQACRQGFWVNACLNEAQARYRQALKPLQQQQQVIEQARRQEIGEQARLRVQDKQEVQAQRMAQGDGPSSALPETPPSQDARLAQARERALRQQQREAAAEQRRRERAGTVPSEADAAQTAPAVR